jgi:hypothetical protein
MRAFLLAEQFAPERVTDCGGTGKLDNRGRISRRGLADEPAGAAPADGLATISGRPRVTVRANYVGLPSMAGRGTDEGGESRRIKGKAPCLVPGSTVPRPKIAACGAPTGAASLAGMPTPNASGSRNNVSFMRGVFVGAPLGAPLPRMLSGMKKTGAPEPDRKTRRMTLGCLKFESESYGARRMEASEISASTRTALP